MFKDRLAQMDSDATRENIEALKRALGVPNKCFSYKETEAIKKNAVETEKALNAAKERLAEAANLANSTE